MRFIAGDCISICPPLIIKPAEIDELFDKLDARARQDARLGEARAAARGLTLARSPNENAGLSPGVLISPAP